MIGALDEKENLTNLGEFPSSYMKGEMFICAFDLHSLKSWLGYLISLCPYVFAPSKQESFCQCFL